MTPKTILSLYENGAASPWECINMLLTLMHTANLIDAAIVVEHIRKIAASESAKPANKWEAIY